MGTHRDPSGEYRLLFSANPIPMWVVDLETRQFLEVNEAALALFGYTRDEFLSLTDPGRRGATVGQHLRKDGKPVTAQTTTQEIVFNERPAQLVLAQTPGALEDLAVQHEAEPLALQTILDEMPAVVFVLDPDGRFILVNTAWERYTGLGRQDAMGKTVHAIFPAEVADRLRLADQAVLDAGVPTQAEVVLPRDGDARTYLVQRFPLRGKGGRIRGLVGIAVDITERKRSEERLLRLSRVVEQAFESVVITDPQGAIIYVNPAFEANSGYSGAEAIGHNPRILKSGHQDAAFYKRMWSTLASGEVWKGRLVNRRKDGTLFQEDATIGPVRDAAGRLVNYVAVKRDVTHEMRLERQLIQAQKMEAVGRLAGGVAHDFNNLLGVITGYGELTLRKLKKSDPLRAKLDLILKAAERAAGLTRQLLAFSRQQVLQPKVVNLNDLVAEMEKMLRRLIGEDVTLESSLEPELGRVKVDPGQIEQVLMNLAVNARDAMPDGGHLTVETQNVDLGLDALASRPLMRAGAYVMLAVSDSGTGMDTETQAHLFEPFFTTKEMGKGTGLGLSTVYGIVKQSEGYIWCYSEIGVGTTFKIYLPRVAEEAAPRGKRAAVKPTRGNETVLLVEDDQLLRELLSEVLEGAGYTVLIADDGAQALQIADQYAGAIQLMITDVIMPGMTGRQAAETIKAVRSEVEVLFISGYTHDAIGKHNVLDPGAKFLSKPFTPNDILRKVRDVLEGR